MKNTYEFTVTLDYDNDEMCIEGKCPQCMQDVELLGFVDVLVIMYHEAYKVAKERNLYGEKKQGTQKKRQKDIRKSCRQNKKD